MSQIDVEKVKELFILSGDILAGSAGVTCKACGGKIEDNFVAIPTPDNHSNYSGFAIYHKTCLLYGIWKVFDEVKLSEEMKKEITTKNI